MTSNRPRTYHTTSAPYMLPNDVSEHERLNLQDKAIQEMMCRKRTHAPVDEPHRILEVGCGTGIMTKHFAERYPQASTVLGIDLSPVPLEDLSPRISFFQGDFHKLACNSEHPELSEGRFDYIFSRLLVYGMIDWPRYIAKAKLLLAPGGWLEIQDLEIAMFDQNLISKSADWQWLREQNQAWAERGLDMNCGPKLEGYLRDAGFVDVQVKKYRWMWGPWEGHPETDMIASYSVKYLPRANVMAVKNVMGEKKTPDELETIEHQIRKDLSWSEDGAHFPFWIVYGRKP